MNSEQARWILKFHRPDRPRNTERRQLQQAIDVILGEETRPQGEWKVRPHTDTDGDCDGYELYCSVCGDVKTMLVNRSFTLDEATEHLKRKYKNFCSNCGADMR